MELNRGEIVLFKNKKTIISLSLISMILVLLTILTLLKVIDYTFITGYLLGTCFVYLSFIFMNLSIKNLTINLNPFNFIFFSILRIGFYIVPFLISIYLPIAFNVYGLLIAFVINWIPSIFLKSKSK
ncbi:MG406 family protein [Spiroplasma monobiae]|uniref:ATP synthase protein I n=1 Tax=Spiroplasma monobiae MQ-1 TaxID=1336748 RepID=A0A2K9LTU6_SPISQ|nr:MG406 family protein [Spiroplasma monobiae]AUM62301.1 hypothetical protein SMONO_v1c00480 [Spiroplasma monobiae MQ-1]